MSKKPLMKTQTATNQSQQCWLSLCQLILISMLSPLPPPIREELLPMLLTWWPCWTWALKLNLFISTCSLTATSNFWWFKLVKLLTPLLLVWTLLKLCIWPWSKLIKIQQVIFMIWTRLLLLMKTLMMTTIWDYTLDTFSLRTCNGPYQHSRLTSSADHVLKD